MHDDGIKPTIVIGHQANTRILQKIREQIDTGDAVFVDCVQQFGNTSAASIPLALGTCVAAKSVPATGRMTLVAYGSGEAWGGVSVDYDLADAMSLSAVSEVFLVTGASRGVGAEVARTRATGDTSS